jgi:hypothetical protein
LVVEGFPLSLFFVDSVEFVKGKVLAAFFAEDATAHSRCSRGDKDDFGSGFNEFSDLLGNGSDAAEGYLAVPVGED